MTAFVIIGLVLLWASVHSYLGVIERRAEQRHLEQLDEIRAVASYHANRAARWH